MSYDAIPEEMKRLEQWVCAWRDSKIPMSPYERKAASSSEPATWGSFEQAAAAVDAGYYDDVGFVFAGNGLVGIDIDCGFDEGLLSELAVDIIEHCGSYTEKSRSGRGVHIILRGDLPFDGKNNLGGVEIYKTGRYFITTGKALIYREIIDNQGGIDYVVEKYFKSGVDAGEAADRGRGQRIYNPVFPPPGEKRIHIRPVYPDILPGCRNISLASLAGQLHSAGYPKKRIFEELKYVNRECCKPPLKEREIEAICDSITKYRR